MWVALEGCLEHLEGRHLEGSRCSYAIPSYDPEDAEELENELRDAEDKQH